MGICLVLMHGAPSWARSPLVDEVRTFSTRYHEHLDRLDAIREELEQDPRFTGMRVGLARTLLKQGRIAEARRELRAVLEEKAPRNLADWVMKDARRARRLLESIR